MRALLSALASLCLLGGISRGQTIEQRLAWARNAVNAYSGMRSVDPPGRSARTTWEITRVDGCKVELKQIWHQDSPSHTARITDRVVDYNFDLSDLQPRDVDADASTGLPHLTIFTNGDIFHLKTDFTGDAPGAARTWTVSGNARNVWIYFDSPEVDNKKIVKRLRHDLRDAVRHCSTD